MLGKDRQQTVITLVDKILNVHNLPFCYWIIYVCIIHCFWFILFSIVTSKFLWSYFGFMFDLQALHKHSCVKVQMANKELNLESDESLSFVED